jgi:hypothetical protein
VQECVTFRRAQGKWSDGGGSIGSVDNKDDGGRARADD